MRKIHKNAIQRRGAPRSARLRLQGREKYVIVARLMADLLKYWKILPIHRYTPMAKAHFFADSQSSLFQPPLMIEKAEMGKMGETLTQINITMDEGVKNEQNK